MEHFKTFYFYLTDYTGANSIIGVQASSLEEACDYIHEHMANNEVEFLNESD